MPMGSDKVPGRADGPEDDGPQAPTRDHRELTQDEYQAAKTRLLQSSP